MQNVDKTKDLKLSTPPRRRVKLILYQPAYPALSVALNLTEPVALNLGTVSLSAWFLFQIGTVLWH